MFRPPSLREAVVAVGVLAATVAGTALATGGVVGPVVGPADPARVDVRALPPNKCRIAARRVERYPGYVPPDRCLHTRWFNPPPVPPSTQPAP